MKMDDMVIISVDDHISEPGDLFTHHLSGPALASAPTFKEKSNGSNYWDYQGLKMASVALNGVVGRPKEEYGMEPTSLDQLRKGCWDPAARVDDMDVNGIAASLNFGTLIGLDGLMFCNAPDKTYAVQHVQAYNDYHWYQWCQAHPGRFIMNGILPAWDIDATVAEIHRLAKQGCTSVSFNENPTKRGLPSIHNAHWEPLWKACADTDMTINLHIGAGNPSPHATDESPIEAWITTMPMSVSIGLSDWLHLEALQRYPLKIAMSESGIGWIPYLLERADYANEQHKAWTHSDSYLKGKKPSDVYHEHFYSCFIDDAYGCRNLDALGEDKVCYEVDYPHSDAPWPHAPEVLWRSVNQLSDDVIDKITHKNAMKLYRFDPFAHHAKEDLTVKALRARAAANGVDTTVKSTGGAAPENQSDKQRAITSGDVNAMFKKHAEAV
ncbi:amidohydrolase family protein [Novosphingobium sp.]|uniref:amidohydrolase family protein n=1 Tax=Novosphingobium sp. TaxID=1874826 RepID=UPI00286E5020|nr:amidohydrolase family protein [Novosphingobium sp.]